MGNNIEVRKFSDVDINDSFFDSLKGDYVEFPTWFAKKKDETAYVVVDDATGKLNGFLYVKTETGAVNDVKPVLPKAKRLKVGTLKINAHGTKLGERVIKKVFDEAVHRGVTEIYVTAFSKHSALRKLFERYGFEKVGSKVGPNGSEDVLLRSLSVAVGNYERDYPRFHTNGKNKFLLAIYPDYHTDLLPDSILLTEKPDIVQDVSHTNSIHKVYIGRVPLTRMKPGDLVVMYRTSDNVGPAYYRSVATSVCVVEEVHPKKDFADSDAFVTFAAPHSVFNDKELKDLYDSEPRLYAVRMTYNAAFKKRPTRGVLLDLVGIEEQPRWDLRKLTDDQFAQILELGEVNESLIID